MTAKIALEWLNSANQMEIDELYKGLVAYSLGLDKISPFNEKRLEKVINYYVEQDEINRICR